MRILPDAEADLGELAAYFQTLNPEFGRRLYLSLKSKIKDLETFPERGVIVPELEAQGLLRYRQVLEEPYRVLYSCRDGTVFVHAIIDGRRDLASLLIKRLGRK